MLLSIIAAASSDISEPQPQPPRLLDQARQSTRRLNQPVPDAIVPQIQVLSFAPLEVLGEAWLDFTMLADVETWLNEYPSE